MESMKIRLFYFISILLIILVFISSFQNQPKESLKSWSTDIQGVGTFSSPRAADLNKDGVLDIIIGTGKEEFFSVEYGVIALDGATGDLLWRVAARDQMFGSAALKDITNDAIPDIFIGGRSAELMAINGANGAIIWEYLAAGDTIPASDFGLYNFYNPQFIPDQNADGIEDIVVANGGDVRVAPNDPHRPPGSLMVVSGKDGSLIARDEMPDGKETYLSAIVGDVKGEGVFTIIFGSGGETIGGHLFRTTVRDVLEQDLSSAEVLASGTDKGFIGPPVFADITGDNILDIVANSVDGRMIAIDGLTNDLLWTVEIPNTEAYTSIAVGYFTSDSIPDFFASYAIGQWPNLGWSRQFMVNGRTGAVEFTDSLGLYQTSSPVVADVNHDGIDDAILSVNFQVIDEFEHAFYYTMLVVIDFKNDTITKLGDSFSGINLSSTPWIGDLDNDNLLDIIYCHTTDSTRTYTFDGFQINRIATDIRIGSEIVWGAYMGSRYDGIFRPNKSLR